MAIVVSDFAALTDDLQSIFNEQSSKAIAEMQATKLFDMKDTSRRTHDHLVLHGIAGVEEVTPGSDLPSVTSEQGDSITYTQKYYGALAVVTKEMRKFDLHDQIESQVRSLAQDAFHKVDQSCADVLLNGWSTSYSDVYGSTVTATGPDGLALFSSVHSNNINSTTFSNLLVNAAGTADPALDRASIVESRARAMRFTDPNGLVRPIMLDTLVVSATNEDLAERILYSSQLPGTPNNDINALKGKVKNLIVWPRLDVRTGGTDTDQYWFMASSNGVKESLKALFAERPSLDAPEQVYENKNWEYSLDFFYTLGLGYAPYIRGSRGTA